MNQCPGARCRGDGGGRTLFRPSVDDERIPDEAVRACRPTEIDREWPPLPAANLTRTRAMSRSETIWQSVTALLHQSNSTIVDLVVGWSSVVINAVRYVYCTGAGGRRTQSVQHAQRLLSTVQMRSHISVKNPWGCVQLFGLPRPKDCCAAGIRTGTGSDTDHAPTPIRTPLPKPANRRRDGG